MDPIQTIQRINDNVYAVKTNDDHTLQFHVRGVKDPETCYHLVEKALKAFQVADDKGFKPSLVPGVSRFHYGAKKWKIGNKSRLGWVEKIIAFFLPFFHAHENKRVHRFRIESALIGPSRKSKSKHKAVKEKKLLQQTLNSTIKVANYRHLSMEGISARQYQKGLRASLPVKKSLFSSTQGAFNDPFTQLATLAFQRYESKFISRDSFVPNMCDYIIIRRANKLELVQKNSPYATEDHKKSALELYKDIIRKEYGTEKLRYIDYLYELDLANTSALTPEHVYRMNIGATSTEIQDMDDLLDRFKDLLNSIEASRIDFQTLVKEKLTHREYSKIRSALRNQGKQMTRADLIQWMKPYTDIEGGVSSLDPQSFAKLLELFKLSEEEEARALTGRKIFGPIASAYTSAERMTYKPWVDQQELTQIRKQLINCSSWSSYQELLAHVVCKKHLFRKYQTSENKQGYRVGELIPAPPKSPGGPPRWYTVSSWATNGYNFSYTLESACKDESLPAIKLYRSTASDPYAMYSKGSILNDFNNLNSPGYMGVKSLEAYERPFFDKRTIPLWVGYQNLAEKILTNNKNLSKRDLKNVLMLLKRSKAELLEQEGKIVQVKKFPEILRENDATLNELMLKYEKFFAIRKINKYKIRFPRLLKTLIKQYIQPEEEQLMQIPSYKVRSDAKELCLYLNNIKDRTNSKRTRLGIDKIIKDLHIHILNPSAQTPEQKQFRKFEKTIYRELNADCDNALKFLNNGEKKSALEALWSMCIALREYAVEKGENIESKCDQDIHVTGHSLGGACAQVGIVEYLTNKKRIPLPGRTCQGFFFDDPAINNADNERFKLFGNENYSLFDSLNIKFSIFRRQEAGDFVPIAGEAHLGATYTETERAKVAKWLEFNAAVHDRLSTSTEESISQAWTVHETRFLEGRRDSYALKKVQIYHPDKYSVPDYIQTHYDTRIQGIFDSRGKKGGDTKKSKRIHRHIYHALWKLPKRFELIFKEEFRKSVSSIFMLLRRSLFNRQDNHLPDSIHLDDYGNLAVDQANGVISSPRL